MVAAIRSERPDVVFAPRVETASGILLPDDYLRALADAVHAHGGLFVLDCIASGALWVDMSATGVDVLISAPQKGWSSSPCCALVMLSQRARTAIDGTASSSFACDLKRELSSDDRVGRAMGVLGTASALGTALGPSLGGLLLATTGWRGVFLLQVPFATVALVLAVAMLPRLSARARSVPATRLRPDARVGAHLAINLLVAAVMMTTLVVGPFYLSGGLGLASVTVGVVLSVGPLVSIATGAPSGRLVDAWGAQRVTLIGLGLLALGTLLLALLPTALGVGAYLLAIAVLTPGYQLFQAANNTAVFARIPKDRRGSASGWITLSRNLGLMAGASVMGSVFALAVGTQDVAHAAPEAVAAGMRFTFLLVAAAQLVVLGMLGAQAVRSRRSASPREPVA